MNPIRFFRSFAVGLIITAAATTHATRAPAQAMPRPAATSAVKSKQALTLDGAKAVVARAAAEARRNNSPGAIAVVDDGGALIYLERLDNTFPAGAAIAVGKARTAALFRRPTKAFEEIIKNGRTAMVALNDFTPLQGGEPIEVDGTVVGAVGVSGATSADMDEQIALAGALPPAADSSDSSRRVGGRPGLPRH
jgi:glc operon protein GlcG